MAVDRVISTTKTTKRVNIDIASFSSSDVNSGTALTKRRYSLPYGQRSCRVGQRSCNRL